jgi:hypothetical protein
MSESIKLILVIAGVFVICGYPAVFLVYLAKRVITHRFGYSKGYLEGQRAGAEEFEKQLVNTYRCNETCWRDK